MSQPTEDVWQLDLSDPDVREMARYSHRPTERWTIYGNLVDVSCDTCHNNWPCPTVLALRRYQ
jgi:hypothetical protein